MSMPHAVQFYEDDVFLIDAVSAFITAGYGDNATIIVVATEKHREDLNKIFRDSGTQGIEAKVKYFDASELLSTFMVDGWPDEIQFNSKIGRIILEAALKGPVRIFGEMVAVLWAEGNTRAAIRLEELWNLLPTDYTFSLLCAYPTSGFPDQKDNALYHQICQQHTHVQTAE